jgi:SAM-dependent methyltransferase
MATQLDVWNEVGKAWVRHGEHFDATLEPFGLAAMDRLALQLGERVLDIGGGAGATAVELARRVTPGLVVSVDLSVPMVAAAQRRIAAAGVTNARAVVNEVEVYARGVEPDLRFDVAFSRMGVMFFEDPVDSFRAIASALMPGGRIGFVCFAELASNPFMSIPIGPALGILDVVLPESGGPGPFSLADPAHIERVLAEGGFHDVHIEEGPTEADLGSADDLDAMALRLLEQNPSTALGLIHAGPDVREVACRAVRTALAEHRRGDRIVAGAGTWLVTARSDP